jgi:hypothetical protein
LFRDPFDSIHAQRHGSVVPSSSIAASFAITALENFLLSPHRYDVGPDNQKVRSAYVRSCRRLRLYMVTMAHAASVA